MGDTSLDPVLATVILRRLEAIGEAMGYALMRSARSSLLVEARDFSAAICDAEGTLIHQTDYIPILGYSAAPAVQHAVAYFDDDVAPGDVIMHNDVFHGGNQLADVKVAKPVFADDELIAWTVISAHQADIGGGVAGSYNPDAREIWQEALRIPPVKVVEAGRWRRDVWDLILANVRLPIVGDDLEAAIGGCTIGEKALQAVVEKYGMDTYRTYSANALDVAEQVARAEIARWPDGEYLGEATGIYDGVTPGSTMEIRVRIVVEGDHLLVDFTGTGPQTPGYVNAPRSTTMSAVLVALYMCLDPNIPHNEGLFRAVTVEIPEGSSLNASYPAATGFGNHLMDHVVPALMRALAQIVPDRVTAGWDNMLAGICCYRNPETDERSINFMLTPCKGGGGGTAGADGADHIGIVGAGGVIGTVDPEMWEIQEPQIVRRFEFIPDSGGPGEWRGGLGVETEMEMLWPTETASIIGDGEERGTSAPGLLGGHDGSPNSVELVLPDGEVIRPGIKSLVRDLPPGTLWRQQAGGGGGFGDPARRDRDRVLADIRAGVVTATQARDAYELDMSEDELADVPADSSRKDEADR